MVSVSSNQQQHNLLVPQDCLPEDAVSVVLFHPDRNLNIFAIGSWDCSVKIFEIVEDSFRAGPTGSLLTSVNSGKIPTKQLFSQKFDAPILDLKWTSTNDSLLIVSGEGAVSLLTIQSMKVNKVLTCPTTLFATAVIVANNPMIVTVSIDGFVRYWTAQDTKKPIKETRLPHAPLCADANPNYLLVGCSQSQLCYIRFCDPDNVVTTTPGIEMIPSVVHLSPTSHDFLIGSVDGRVLVAEFMFHLDKFQSVSRKIAFKAHKDEPDRGPKRLFHINSMSFPDFPMCKTNIVHSSATEGILKIWDLTKKETTQEIKYSTMFGQITASGVSANLKYAVVCCGYDWSQGVWGIERQNPRHTGDINAVCIVITPLSIELPKNGMMGQ